VPNQILFATNIFSFITIHHSQHHTHTLLQLFLTLLDYHQDTTTEVIWIKRETTPCPTEEEAMALAVVVVEEEEDIQMGTMTIPADTTADSQEVETILQPIPAGMTIQGLEVAV